MAVVQLRIGTVQHVDQNGQSIPVWTPLSVSEPITSDGTNKTTTLAVTAELVARAGGVNRLAWRATNDGSETVKCARGLTPDATGTSQDWVLGKTVEYFGVEAVGEKVAITNL